VVWQPLGGRWLVRERERERARERHREAREKNKQQLASANYVWKGVVLSVII